MEKTTLRLWIEEIELKGTCPKCHAMLEDSGAMGSSFGEESLFLTCPKCCEEYTLTTYEATGEKTLDFSSDETNRDPFSRFFELLNMDRCPECGRSIKSYFDSQDSKDKGLVTAACVECGFLVRGRGDVFFGEELPAGIAEGSTGHV